MELLENRKQADIVDEIFLASEKYRWNKYISVGSFYTLTYLTERMLHHNNYTFPELLNLQRSILGDILSAFSISPLSADLLLRGVEDDRFKDLEDSYQHKAAMHSNCDCILTLNCEDYKQVNDILIVSPEAFKQQYLAM